MKDKEKKVNENCEEQASESVKETETAQADEVNQSETKIDVDKLTEKQAREMLKEVLNSNKEIIAELEATHKDSEKFKDNWYRTTAEYENFKKRNADIRKNSYDDGKKDAIMGVFTIGDSLDRALSMEMDEKTKSGVELIKRQFTETMKALGVEEINPNGEQFSPETAEAIAMVDAVEGEESGVVRNVFKKGYKLNGKTMRYAQVIVVK